MPKSKKTIPIYEYPEKVNGQTRYYIRPYIKDEFGNIRQITKRLDDNGNIWLGREGYVKAIEEITRLQKDIQSVNKDITVKQAIEEYLNYIKPTIKTRSFVKKEDNFRLHVLPYFANRKIFKITRKEAKDWQIMMCNKTYIKGKKEHLYSETFLNDIYVDFSAVFQYCIDFYRLKENVIQFLGPFKLNDRRPKEKEILNENEIQKVINAESQKKYQEFFSILFYTGLRRGEICGLKIKNINLDENLIVIKSSLWQRAKKEEDKETTTKTKSSERVVPILEEIRIVLEEKVKNATNSNEFVFGGDRYFSESTIRRRLNNCIIKSGINKHITPHCLRHSFITMCAKRKVRVDIVSKIVGHKHISTTYDIYTHVEQCEVKLFNDLFHNKTNTRPTSSFQLKKSL